MKPSGVIVDYSARCRILFKNHQLLIMIIRVLLDANELIIFRLQEVNDVCEMSKKNVRVVIGA